MAITGMLNYILLAVFLLAVLVLGIVLIASKKGVVIGKIIINIYILVAIGLGSLFGAFMIAFTSVNFKIYIVLLLIAVIGVSLFISALIWGKVKKKLIYIPVICLIGVSLLSFGAYKIYQSYDNNITVVGEPKDLLSQYQPYSEDSKVVILDEPSTLTLSENIPRLDGATALYPIYSAFARAIFPREALKGSTDTDNNSRVINGNEYLKCTTTTYAYNSIINGSADVIFVAAPSKEQEEVAKDNGIELIFTPIGNEAFVFFVNAKNPIDNLTIEEIQQIYSGEITNWNQIGTNGLGEIRAFQRDQGSGSQSALQRLMEGKDLMTPPKEDVISGMGGIIKQTADYKNYKNAMGYSFRFYSTEMVKDEQIKLLSINNVFPSEDNIENGTYPIASNFYAVTRSDASENTKKLIDWILSEQGQMIISETGYTPLIQY